MLPEGWEYANLGGITSHRKGHPFKSNTYKTHGTRVIRISDTTSNSIHSLNPVFIENNGSENLDEFALKHGDIILTTVGSKPHLIDSMVGKAVRIPDEIDGALLNQNLVKLSPNDKFIISDILFLYLKSRNFISYISDLVRGNANQVSISLKDIFAYRVLLPPLPEQKKIAAILSTWDRAIEGTEELLANSQQQKKALMQQLLTGKKRLPGFTGEWKTVTIGSLLKEAKRPVEWKDDNFYKLLSVKRRSEGVILREMLHGTKILTKKMNYAKSGDFLISKMQVVHGASGLVPEHLDNHHISDSYIALRAKNPEKFDIEFFSWLSKERVMYHKTFLCSYGVTIEKMTFNFNMYLKENIKIPPTVTEQRSISQLLNTTENEITALESDLSRLRQEKKALMQQLLTGKRRVTVD